MAAQPRALALALAPNHGTTATTMIEVRTTPPSPPHPHTVRICAGQRQQHQHQQRKKGLHTQAKKRAKKKGSVCEPPPPLDMRRMSEHRRRAETHAELHTRGAEGFFLFSKRRKPPTRDAGEEAVCPCPFGAWRLVRSRVWVIGYITNELS